MGCGRKRCKCAMLKIYVIQHIHCFIYFKYLFFSSSTYCLMAFRWDLYLSRYGFVRRRFDSLLPIIVWYHDRISLMIFFQGFLIVYLQLSFSWMINGNMFKKRFKVSCTTNAICTFDKFSSGTVDSKILSAIE